MTEKRKNVRRTTTAVRSGETAQPLAARALALEERSPIVLVNKLKLGQTPIEATAQLAVAGLANRDV
jgi:hypothetical protein